MKRRFVALLAFLLVVAFAWPAQAQLISAVAHRNTDTDAPEDPQIAPNPLDEGSVVFVARSHVYKDVPLSLVGIEYIMLANDNKNHSAYELDVTVSRNATIYVFVDNRMGGAAGGKGVAPNITGMAWLTQMGFVDTGEDIGIDENADGSINQYFSAFALAVTPGTYTLRGCTQGHEGNMLGVAVAGRGPATAATNPVPEDGMWDVPRDVLLGWNPGEGTATRNVYLGTDFADVNNATVDDPRTAVVVPGHGATTFQPPTLLDYGQTYYWRIDEVNAADWKVTKGTVWSFKVEPRGYRIENVTATASSRANAAADAINVVNGSGLTLAADGQYVHDTSSEHMWQSAMPGLPATIAFEFDKAYKLHEMKVWNHNTLNEGFLHLGAEAVTIEIADSNEGPWTPVADVTLNQAPGAPDAPATDTIPMMGVVAGNVRLTIRSNHGQFPSTGLADVQFFYIPVAAREWQPANGATLAGTEVILTWRSGRGAAQHKVYLATQENLALVEASDPAALVATIAATDSYASHAATDLHLAQTCVWKVEEINPAHTPSSHDSPIQLDGVDDHVVVAGVGIAGAAPRTICGWAKADRTGITAFLHCISD